MLFPPAAHTSLDATPSTASAPAGLGTALHCVPSQCIMPHVATAQASLVARAVTAVAPNGLGTTFHCVPSQCNVPSLPTAHMSFADTASMPDKPPMSAHGSTFHRVPSQW